MDIKERESEIKRILAEDPGDPTFAEYGDFLRRRGETLKAIDVCLAGLSVNPDCHRGRIVLARAYYDRLYLPFAVRELEILRQALPDNRPIEKIIAKLAPDSGPASGGSAALQPSTLAEAEMGFDEIELIEEEEKAKSE